MASLVEIVEAMAAALDPVVDAIPGLQVSAYMLGNPTPPCVDIYPGDPFFEGPSGFGDDIEAYFTVRARTTTADLEGGQKALLRMLDPRAPESVEAALTSDQTLGGVCQSLGVVPEEVTGYREYLEDTAANGRLIGCQWRVRVIT